MRQLLTKSENKMKTLILILSLIPYQVFAPPAEKYSNRDVFKMYVAISLPAQVEEMRAALESALGCLKQAEYWCRQPETIIKKCEDALQWGTGVKKENANMWT